MYLQFSFSHLHSCYRLHPSNFSSFLRPENTSRSISRGTNLYTISFSLWLTLFNPLKKECPLYVDFWVLHPIRRDRNLPYDNSKHSHKLHRQISFSTISVERWNLVLHYSLLYSQLYVWIRYFDYDLHLDLPLCCSDLQHV